MGGCATKHCYVCCQGEYTEYKLFSGEHRAPEPSCWPCYATALYVPMPLATNDEWLRQDAEYLYRSMKGLGTKDGALGRCVAARTLPQLRAIKKIFDNEFGNDDTLEQWIQDDTSGDWQKILLMKLRPRGLRNAMVLHYTMDGLGTADDELRELMAVMSNAEMQEAKEAYEQKYGRTLGHDIKDDTSWDYKRILMAMIDRAGYLAKQLHDAISGAGTDDIRLIRILANTPRSYATLRGVWDRFEDTFNEGWKNEFEFELSMPDLQDVKAAYQRIFHRSLVKDVAGDTSGMYRRLCLTLLQPPEETTADAFHLAMEGKGTNDDLLVECAACNSNRRLFEAAQVYNDKYHRALRDAVKSDTLGDYQKTLVSVLTPRAIQVAWSLHDSMEGLGTDDTRLMNLVVGKSRYELRSYMKAYKEKYQKDLEDEIRSETSFWYKRYLVYILRQAEEDVIWVPENQLLRYRDF